MLANTLARPRSSVLDTPGLDPSGDVFDSLVSSLAVERFDPARLGSALALFPVASSPGQSDVSPSAPGRLGYGDREGRTFRLAVAPGMVSLAAFDATRRERRSDRERLATVRESTILAGELLDRGEFVERPPTRYIAEWSAKSRSRMVQAFASADWSGLLADSSRPLGMITLTLPGDWLAVAPSGRIFKRQIRAFLERWRRALGSRLVGGWKLEFQRRGAPHLHIITGIPAMVGPVRFEAWLSKCWADVVGAKDVQERINHLLAGTAVDFREVGKMTDPRRLAVYFLGHSTKSHDSKEYQHVVPVEWQTAETAPGRFWGFWGLPAAVEALDLGVDDFLHVRRVLRRVAAGRARRIAHDRAYWAARKAGLTHAASAAIAREARPRRALRSLGAGGQLSGGFVVVNDGAQLAEDLARSVLLHRGSAVPARFSHVERDDDGNRIDRYSLLVDAASGVLL